MILDANSISILKNLETDVDVFRTLGAYVKGNYQKTTESETRRLIVLPISGEDVKNAEPGSYTSEDKLVIELGGGALKDGDQFNFEGRTFKIVKQVNYISIANLTKYIAKKNHAS
ncbi:hypothetical protein LEP1GSC126_3376 [Leptospira kirschneri str. 200801774]|uniref:hypothetical protein n=1 Tax=Leptospira kirschneri TaxID=29507 RepID=UPI0002BF9D6E|nr:hypothetical protein [Leptospira kirschneri]EMO80181.1 hypothetical protein LEP1GSC126_3376 [Leptospira kirschneri str. 200801774]